jgi:hypothetical protein
MAKLTKAEIRKIEKAQAEVFAPGTPENGYADSGLWKFLSYVYTKDAHDKQNPVKRLLGPGDEYAIIVFLYMLACTDLLVPKSRQIRMSWFSCTYALWVAMSGAHRHVVYQTKKEEDAFAQTSQGSKNPGDGRMDFIVQHLPAWLRDPYIVSGKGNMLGTLNFWPHQYSDEGVRVTWAGSKVNAVPQGAKQIRQYTPTLYINDESAFQEEYREAMIAAGAAVTGGGQSISVSSVDAGSFFNQSVLNIKGGGEPEHREIHPAVKIGMEKMGIEWPKGMRSWQTAGGAWVLEVKYTADPRKDPDRDGAQWYADAVKRSGYEGDYNSVGWQTEMEINYGAGGGDPVFPFIEPGCAIFIDGFATADAVNKMRFFAGYDYGSQNPSAFVVWGIDKEGKAYSVWELYEPNTNMAQHVEKIKRCPYWDRIEKIICDPSIGYKTQHAKHASDIKTLIELYEEHGLYLTPGRRAQDVSVAQMFKSTYWADPKSPTAFLTKATPNLNRELMDLRWEKHVSSAVEARKNAPEKIRQKNNHAWDATAVLFDDGVYGFVDSRPARRAGTFAQAVDDLRLVAAKERKRSGGIHVL